MKNSFKIFILLISIFYWSLTCYGWWDHRDFPPADAKNVVAETFFSGGIGPHKGYSGLGEKSDKITYETYYPWPDKFTNSYNYHTIISKDDLPDSNFQTYLLANASGNSNNVNMAANRTLLDYTCLLRSKRQNAPKDVYITVVIQYSMDLSINGCPPCPTSYKCNYGAKAVVFVYDPKMYDPTVPGKWPPILYDSIEITEEDYPLDKKSRSARMTSGTLPGQSRNIRLYAYCNLLCAYEDSVGSDGCIASIDPVITIDPNEKVYIEGVEYLANEVYEIQYSQALIDFKQYHTAMPLPESQQVFAPTAASAPVLNADPASANPIGLGSVAEGGDTLDIRIGTTGFSGPGDVYFAVYSPQALGEEIFLYTGGTFVALSQAGLVPWIASTNGPLDQNLFGAIPLSLLPSGAYTLYFALAPAGSQLATFYLWSTAFTVP